MRGRRYAGTVSGPAIVVVDDDDDGRTDLVTALDDRYGRHYDVRQYGSSVDAATDLERFAAEGDEIAIVLVALSLIADGRHTLLDDIRRLHPHAKRLTVIEWDDNGDPEVGATILDAVGNGRLDHFVLRPASPADEALHSTITGLLLDWNDTQRVSPHTVHIVGESWHGRAYDLRNTLGRCALPHTFSLADSETGRRIVEEAGGVDGLPLVVFPNGTVLRDPTNAEIAAATGTPVRPERRVWDLVIIGSGPAGLSAAVYGASEGLATLVIDEGGVGGQATSSSLIRNYLGFPPGVSGRQLSRSAFTQAWVFGARFMFMQGATDVRRRPDTGQLTVQLAEGDSVPTRAVLLATGASWRRLGVPELEALTGSGVYYGGPTSEIQAMAGREVYVVGGANSAGQAALHLARFARRVTMVIRGDALSAGMSDYLLRQVSTDPHIEVRLRTEIVGGGGAGRLERLVLNDLDTGAEESVAADALFLLIGAEPHTEWLPDEIARDEQGFVLTGADVEQDAGWPLSRARLHLETSVPGVFAAGDARHGSVKRVASAVGEGSVAIQLLHQLSALDAAASLPAEVIPAT